MDNTWRTRAVGLAVLVGLLSTLLIVVGPPAAQAATMPGAGAPGVTGLCISNDYSCTSGGYTGSEPWGYYTAYGSRDAAGRLHNCTTYAAFRAARNGAPKPTWYGNADQWDDKARAAGVRVDGIAAAGAIAQWNGPPGSAGHVAYVESVDAEGIVTTDDAYSGQVTTRLRILRWSPSWPDNFIHLADVGGFADGSFVQADDNNEVYRIVGGAPVYVSTWAPFGGEQPLTRVPRAQLNVLPRYPADGTVVAAGPFVYRFAGGAPVYVSSWEAIGGLQPITVVDAAAIDHADGPSPWHHVRRYPADGTVLATSAFVYVVAGGAPVYVSSWDAIGGYRSPTLVDQAAIANAGLGAPWDHVRRYPADNTFVRGPAGDVFRFAGGAPIYVSDWAVFGGVQPTTLVDGAALANADLPEPYSHVRRVPADGTFLQEPVGTVYVVAGGAPLWVSRWDPWGGVQPTVFVDPAAVANAGGPGSWSHLRRRPSDGTRLRTVPSNRFWNVTSGVLSETTGGVAVLVNDESINGLPGGPTATSFRLDFTDAEYARVLQSAAYVGRHPDDLARWTIAVFQFLYAISEPKPAPTQAVQPSMAGPWTIVTTWPSEQLPALEAFRSRYGLGPAEAQKFAVLLLSFLLMLDGH